MKRGSSTTDDHQVRTVIETLMYELGMVAQSVVNKMNMVDERAKAEAYIKIVTRLIDNVSKVMKELNRLGIEKIKREYSLIARTPDNKGIIV